MIPYRDWMDDEVSINLLEADALARANATYSGPITVFNGRVYRTSDGKFLHYEDNDSGRIRKEMDEKEGRKP